MVAQWQGHNKLGVAFYAACDWTSCWMEESEEISCQQIEVEEERFQLIYFEEEIMEECKIFELKQSWEASTRPNNSSSELLRIF